MSRIRKAHRHHTGTRGLVFVLPIVATAIAAVVLIAVLTLGAVLSYGQDLPKLREGDLPRADQTTKVYSPDGKLLTSFYAEQNRVPLPFAKIPAVMRNAVVDIEDERFWTHDGVDFQAIGRALRVNLTTGRVLEGGSTIDQQYVRTVLISREKTMRRKIREAMLAYQLEKTLTKRQILERYLNTVYFGAGAYGVEAASVTYFGKHAGKLTLPEAALLAGVIKSPTHLSPYANPKAARGRRNAVLVKMRERGHISARMLASALASPVRVKPLRPPASRVPYFTEYVKQHLIDKYGADVVFRGGLRVYTTIDLRVQQDAERAWREVLGRRSDPSVAIVAIDPRNGFIKAMVGGRDFAKSKYNLATQAHRQPGSAFKPFVLATALEGGMSPDKKIDSAPALIRLPGGGTWNVDNATEGSGGAPMPLRDATVHSVNAVFARLIMQVGPEKVVSTARGLGIRTRLDNNPAIALGGMRQGVTPLEMASAFGSFANGGVWREPTAITGVKDSSGLVLDTVQPVALMGVSAGTAYLVTDILKGVIREGTGTEADIGRPAAGKTGTTQSYRDAWFAGYVPRLAAAVWVGYPRTERPMTNVRGITVKGGTFPAMIWARFMRRALAHKPGRDFAKPGKDLVRATVCSETNLLATRYCPDPVVAIFARSAKPTRKCDLHASRSSSSLNVIVPKVIGMSKASAIARIRAAGLSALVRSVSDGTPGVVLSQRPGPGAAAPKGSAVTISVPNGSSGGGGGSAAPSNRPPVASFSVSSSTLQRNQTMECDAASSWDPDGNIAAYEWNFGDGRGGSGETAAHAYSRTGAFTATLTVRDTTGLTESASKQITVR